MNRVCLGPLWERSLKNRAAKRLSLLFCTVKSKTKGVYKRFTHFIPVARHNAPLKLEDENLPGRKNLTGKILESIDNKRLRGYFPNRSRKASINGGKTL
jgi:hypothetical protein